MIMILRYIVLAGSRYYPVGWNDYRGEFATQETAEQAAKNFVKQDNDYAPWWQVVDLMTKEVVAQSC